MSTSSYLRQLSTPNSQLRRDKSSGGPRDSASWELELGSCRRESLNWFQNQFVASGFSRKISQPEDQPRRYFRLKAEATRSVLKPLLEPRCKVVQRERG